MENKKKDTKFQIGNTLGKGRGVSGRRKCLDTLDKMLAMEGNQNKYMEALQEGFNKDPLKFVHKYVVPVMPLFARDPKFEEILAQMTDEERLQGIDAILAAVRKRITGQVVKDDSFVESEGIEFSTN